MGKSLTVDYNAEQDILYLRADLLPRYRVREPADGFLVYVAREPKHEIVGFEILDFAGYPFDDFRERLSDYLCFNFDVPALGLTDAPLSDILTAVKAYLNLQHPTQASVT
jgi:hypothetical protein